MQEIEKDDVEDVSGGILVPNQGLPLPDGFPLPCPGPRPVPFPNPEDNTY